MRQPSMRVRLVASPWMDARGHTENQRIRIPKRGRLFFDVKNSRLVIKTTDRVSAAGEPHELGLSVRQARKEDVDVLLEDVKQGRVSSDQADITAFVTTATRNAFLGRRTNTPAALFLTDRVDALKIGCDPEFVLVNPKTSDFVYAGHVRGLGIQDPLGSDGPLAELRPHPETSAEMLTKRIGNLFTTHQDKIANYLWLGGASYRSEKQRKSWGIGGHIHVGDPPMLPANRRQATYVRAVQILDEMVALPMVRVDAPDPRVRRQVHHYGVYGDQRPQEGRFEWRVLSGFWLLHADIAQAVLGTAKAVSEACYHRMVEHDFAPEYLNTPLQEKGFLQEWGALPADTVRQIVDSANPRLVTGALMTRTKTKLRELSNYTQYKAEIEQFIDIVELSGDDQKRISFNLRRNWVEGGAFLSPYPKAKIGTIIKRKLQRNAQKNAR